MATHSKGGEHVEDEHARKAGRGKWSSQEEGRMRRGAGHVMDRNRRRSIKKKGMCEDVPETTVRTGTSFFFLAFIWHSKLLPWMYSICGRDLMVMVSFIHEDRHLVHEELELGDVDLQRDFAFMGAITHTVVFIFGLLCVTLLRRLRLTYYTGTKEDPEPIGIIASLALALWAAAIFHGMAWRVLSYCFETKYGPVFRYARIFFKENGGESPFSWVSSVSYTSALVLGFLISTEKHISRFEKFVLPSETLRSWGSYIGIPFAMWMATLDRVTLPMYESLFLANLTASEPGTLESEMETIRQEGRSMAFVLGLIMCCAIPTFSTVVRSCDLTRKRVEEGIPYAGLLQETRQSSYEIFQTFFMSLCWSGLLLSMALYGENVALGPVLATANMIFTARFMFVLVSFFSLYGMILLMMGEKISIVAPTNRVVRAILAWGFVAALWNVHLICFFGSWGPYYVWAFLGKRGLVNFSGGPYSYLSAFLDGLMFVAFVSYLFPVVFQGTVKVLSVQFKRPWGVFQECLVGFMCVIPSSTFLWYQWTRDLPGLPVHLLLTAIHLRYLLTYKGRPEYTGSRYWPEFRKATGLWAFIEEYFRMRIIVDGDGKTAPHVDSHLMCDYVTKSDFLQGFEGDRPRIFGFHPHGIYPASVVFTHCLPVYQRIFSKLQVHSLTDAFIFVVPMMRDIALWAGGREIYKPIVNEMMKKKSSVILVPGGQQEILLHTRENLDARRIVLYAKHKGFVRMALEHGADLVPMFNFGELQAIECIYLPTIQTFSRKVLGFPMPFLPVGQLDILPFPRYVKMSLVIGNPIQPTIKTPGHPTEAEVEHYHTIYYRQLKALIDKYKHVVGDGHDEFEVELRGVDSDR